MSFKRFKPNFSHVDPHLIQQYCDEKNNPFIPYLHDLFKVLSESNIEDLLYDEDFQALTEIDVANIIAPVLASLKG